MGYGIFRLEKIKLTNSGELAGRIRHSWRENKDPSLDKEKCQFIGGQTAKEVYKNHKKNVSTLSKAPRSTAVGNLEIVITTSKDSIPKDKQAEFYNDSVEQLKKIFGEENVCGVALHKDETTPHLHAFITPVQTLEDGTKKLNAKHWTGGKTKMRELQDKFYDNVFSKYGLERGESAELTKRKNQRPTLESEKAVLRGKEQKLEQREKKVAQAEKNIKPKIDALKRVESVQKFPPVLDAVPVAKLPVKKVFESAEKVVKKTAEVTLKFCQKQYQALHKAYIQVSQALGAEQIYSQSLNKDNDSLHKVIEGMSKELEQIKKDFSSMTPETAEKLAKEMRANNCQNYGELNQKTHEKKQAEKQAEIDRQNAEKAQKRAQARKRGSDMGMER